MLRTTFTLAMNQILNNISFSKKENLDARTRRFITDGYRTSVPGTTNCRSDNECEIGEICQAGYCHSLLP